MWRACMHLRRRGQRWTQTRLQHLQRMHCFYDEAEGKQGGFPAASDALTAASQHGNAVWTHKLPISRASSSDGDVLSRDGLTQVAPAEANVRAFDASPRAVYARVTQPHLPMLSGLRRSPPPHCGYASTFTLRIQLLELVASSDQQRRSLAAHCVFAYCRRAAARAGHLANRSFYGCHSCHRSRCATLRRRQLRPRCGIQRSSWRRCRADGPH